MWNAFYSVLHRELLLAFRNPRELLQPLTFFVITTCLFPLALNPESSLLQTIAPGVLWVSALLALLLSVDKIFQIDWHDGSLQHYLLSPQPLSLLVFAKVLAHWLTYGLPLIFITPLLGLFYQLPIEKIVILMQTLVLGTPTLSLLGTLGAALTIGLRQSNLLLALLILPLLIPILIFATSAVTSLQASAELSWLSVLLVLALFLTPTVSAFSLRALSF